MAVPVWKRKLSSAQFIYEVYTLNIRLGSANNWWERSPNASNSTNFCNVNSNGNANYNNATNTNGLAPFGCINTGRRVTRAKSVPQIVDTGRRRPGSA